MKNIREAKAGLADHGGSSEKIREGQILNYFLTAEVAESAEET
jgi:hypothetical protein